MPAGRPKKTTEDFPSNWKDEVLALASQGASDVEIRVFLDICHETWQRMIDEDREFSETIKKAHDHCRLWWEKSGRLNLENKEFSPTLWYMNMKNRFGWADKQEVKQEVKADMKHEIDLSKLSIDELELATELQLKSRAGKA